MRMLSIGLFTIITLLWLGEFILFRPRHRSQTFEEKRSFSWITVTIVVSIALSVQGTRMELFVVPQAWRGFFEVLGLLVYAIGISLRYLGSIALGAQFTRNVSVSVDQPLVSHSVYRYMRHPLYLGLFLLLVAVPVYLGNWLMMLTAGAWMYLILRHRIQLEEAKMEEVLGERYVEWKTTRGKFFPALRQKPSR